MSETVNANEPAPTNSGASPLTGTGGVNRETYERLRWLERQMAAARAVMERKVPPRELRVLWQVLEWSFGLGRETTRPFIVCDMAARTGMTTAGACRALNGLKEKRIIRKNADGSRQFTPESKFHQWMVPWRVDDEGEKLAAARVDTAQGVSIRSLRPEIRDRKSTVGGQPEGGTKNEDEKSKMGNWKAAKKQNGEQPMKGETNMKEQNADDHGTHETHGNGGKGGDGVFLPPDITNSANSAPDVPLKSSLPSPKTPFNTIYNSLKGESVASLATTPEASSIDGNGTEAGMEKGSPIPEDPMDASEDTLMRRLMGLLGKETMKKDGARLRLFIRGSLEAADCEDTAVAIRKAINETEAALREGRIKKSVFGYLFSQSFYWAGQMGWKFDAEIKRWVKCAPFNTHQHRNANRRRK